MSSTEDTPILIESDNDSDVEILHEEKNADLDIIFVSETIHVKDEDKDLPEKTKTDCSQDVGFNRSLSISSNLDISLQLNDTSSLPVAGSSGCTPCCDLLQSPAVSVVHDNVPLNLSTSSAKYDDISDSSGEETSDSDESSSDCDSVSTPVYTRSPVLAMPVLYQCDNQLGVTGSMKSLKPMSFSTHDVSLGTNSPQVHSATCVSPKSDAAVQNLQSVLNRAVSKIPGLQSQSSNSTTVTPSAKDGNISTTGQLHTSQLIDKNQGVVRPSAIQTQQHLSSNTSCLSNQNSNILGTSSTMCDPAIGTSSSANVPSTSSQSKSLDEVFDELVQDLDFLDSGPHKPQSLSKYSSMSTDQCSSASSDVKITGIKRTLSDQNFKSKHDDKTLPPKKQTRYLHHQGSVDSSDTSSWGSEKCSQCMMLLLGVKLSRCVQGHPSCTNCLEEKVKVVLTGKIKESLHCLKLGCDSYFPLSELNQSLPKMVVDILETKLDEDHVDYIHNMLLKNASTDATAPNMSTEDVPVLSESKGTSRRDSLQEPNRILPENWTEMDRKKVYDLYAVEPGSPEYITVAMKFHESMQFPSADIVKVSRIQNPILWQYFTVKRSEMIQENEGLDVEERKLFHGTHATVVEPICKKGFDWRVCGKNGTVYGQGSYFAVNASYSHQYTDNNGCRRSRAPSQRSFVFPPPPAHTGSAFQPNHPFHRFTSRQTNAKYKLLGPGQPPAFVLSNANAIPFFQNVQNNASMNTVGSINQQGLSQNPGISQQGPGQSLINQQGPGQSLINQQGPGQNLINQQGPGQNPINQQGPGQSLINQQGPGQSLISQQGPGQNLTITQQAPGQNLTTNQQVIGQNPVTISQPGISVQPLIINPRSVVQPPIGQPQVGPPQVGQPQVGQPLLFNHVPAQSSYVVPEPQSPLPLHKMIMSRVLVGKWTGGQANLRKPPALFPDEDLSGRCYDSCVDNIHDPKIFVVFDSAQAYPEYLIEYHCTEFSGR